MPVTLKRLSRYVTLNPMKGSPYIRFLLGLLWMAVICLWPEDVNVRTKPEEIRPANIGEGLYKNTHTNANFGLLGVRFYETNQGKKRWKIQSEFAELHRKENYAFLENVTTEFFAAATGNVVTTTSKYGRAYLDKDLVELQGDVVIRSKKGYHFSMNRLFYNSQTHRFTTDEAVTMKGPNAERPRMILRGVGLVGEIDTEQFILQKNVHAQRLMKTKEWVRIHSRSGEFYTDSQRAIFTGNVTAYLPKVELMSDALELNVAENNELVQAYGKVRFKTKERTGKSDTAEIEVGGSRMVLEGRAEVNSVNNQIRGQRVILYTDEDRVEVEEAEGRLKN